MTTTGHCPTRSFSIGETMIDDDSACYVIAEIGHNHQGDFELCKKMFSSAAECGAHAVKLQKRSPRDLFTQKAFDTPYNSENSFGATYGEHREYLEFSEAQLSELKAFSRELGVHFICTAFDEPSLELLGQIKVDAIKIASGDVVNHRLLAKAAECGIPLIVSTGAANWEEVQQAYDVLSSTDCEFALLQCTSAYPAKFDQLDLSVISTYRETFPETVVGLSSHDNGGAMPLVAYALGARIVEKHYTIDRTMKGTDQAFSLSPSGLRRMCKELGYARAAMGDGTKKVYDSELGPIAKQRKSVVAARHLREGDILRDEDLTLKVPNEGLPAKRIDSLIGRRLVRSLDKDAYVLEADLD